MKFKSIKSLLNEQMVGQTVTTCGWVKTKRDSKSGISFINLNDGSCFDNLQIIAPDSLGNYQDILQITSGYSISVSGKIVASQGKNQLVEMQAEHIDIIGTVTNPESYPIQPKRHTMEFLREVAHLRPRTNTFGAVTRIRHALSVSIHNFLNSEGFYWIHTPIITTNDCEGAGELFRVSTLDLNKIERNQENSIDFKQDFFGRETFLTVSGQLNVEAYCMALSKVYTFGPTFRAENSNTSRHLAEFWMVEPEMAFANLDDVIALSEKMLKHIVKEVFEKCHADFEFISKFVNKDVLDRIDVLANKNFARLTYSEAIIELTKAKQKFEFPVAWGIDLQSEHERYLCEHVTKRTTIITDYPKEIKSFYMRVNDDEKTVAAMDMLAPGIGEIIGGSQREERLDKLEDRIAEMNIDKQALNWYLDLRRYGTTPHGGFGLGLERLLGYITGIKNVRDLIPFPRTPGSANW